MNEPEPKPKQAALEVPESEIELQENLETSKKAVIDEKHKQQTEDLHLQDLTYEENLKKEKKKRGHHGAHQAGKLILNISFYYTKGPVRISLNIDNKYINL